MPLTSPGNDDDTGENHQPTLRKNTAEPVEQTLKQNKQKRMEDWAVANGYRVVASVAEVGSGVNDKRRKLTALLKRDDWGTLIVEHKDRLTRFGFEWFRLFAEQTGRRILVVNEAADDRTDLIQDLVSIIYSFSARLYGRRRAERAQRIVRLLEEGGSDGEQD